MLRITVPKIKRTWALGLSPRCRWNTRTFTSRNRRLSVSVLRRAAKSTKAGKEHDAQCHKCKQLIEFIFGPPSTIDNPYNQSTLEKFDESKQGTAETQLSCKPETHCEKCNKLIAKAFTTHEYGRIPKTVTKLPIDDVHALQSSTAKQTEEQLAQKIEVIEETPLVEAESPKLEGFNVTPRVLGHLVDMNIIRTIEFIGNDDHCDMSVLNFATNDSGHNSKSSGSDDLDPFEIVAQRCLDEHPNRIDDRILKQLKQLGIPRTPNTNSTINVSDNKRKPGKTEVVEELDARKIDHDPSSTTLDEQGQINNITKIRSQEQSEAALYSQNIYREQTAVSQLSNTYPTTEEISRGLPDPQSFYSGFKPEQPTGGEATHTQPQQNHNHVQSTSNQNSLYPAGVTSVTAQQQYFYNNASNYAFPSAPQFPQGFYNPGYWPAPTEQTAGHEEHDIPTESTSDDTPNERFTIVPDQKTPSRAIEGRHNISRETLLSVPYEIEKPTQGLLHPEYICPAPRIQTAEHERSKPLEGQISQGLHRQEFFRRVPKTKTKKYVSKKQNKLSATNNTAGQISEDRLLQKEYFSRVPKARGLKGKSKTKIYPKKETSHGLVLQESFYINTQATANEPCFTALKIAPQSILTQNITSIYPDQKTPIRAIEGKPDIGSDNSKSTDFCAMICPLPQSQGSPQSKDDEMSLSQMLNKVRQNNRESSRKLKKVDPVRGKCGKGKPKCPPPPPPCPPPDPCPPRPCPTRDPPCPRPCKRACPPACTPPTPGCDPRNYPCKFKKLALNTSLENLFSLLFWFGSKKFLLRRCASLSMIDSPTQTAGFSTKAILPHGISVPKQNSDCALIAKQLYESNIEKCSSETILLARTFDPWVPIPSWPIPEKVEKRPFLCPKEGCKVIPPPRLGAPCGSPCKGGDPCKGFPKRRS